jgi:hypothetical protein
LAPAEAVTKMPAAVSIKVRFSGDMLRLSQRPERP